MLFVLTQEVYRIYATLCGLLRGLPFIECQWRHQYSLDDNTNAEVNGYSIYLRLHLSILKTLLAPFDEEVFCFATVLSLCLRHAAFARNRKDANLNPTQFFLGQDIHVSCVCTHGQMAFASKFSTVSICIMHAYVCMCLIVLWPPDNTHFTPIDKFRLSHLIHRESHLKAGHMLFSHPL